MVLLHGGPGAGSFYLKPFERLGNDRRVIRYDQLGAGRSDRLTDTSRMNIAHFVAELDSLRSALHITRWYLNGQSWGTVLALEYWKAHPEHVAGIVFGSPVFDWRAYQREARAWLPMLSDSAQRAIADAEKSGSFDTPGYKAATDEYYAKFVFRRPVPADAESTFATFGQETYARMQGPNEFTITGTLRNYDRTTWLPQLQVPVLVTAGEFDEVGPKTVRRHAGMIPGAGFILYPGAAHVTSWDATDSNVSDVRKFLRAADRGKR
jgi:proline iminopeptidase